MFQTINEVRLSDDHNRIALNDAGAVAFLAVVDQDNRDALIYANADGVMTAIAVEGESFELPVTGETKTIATDGGILFQGGSNSSGGPVGFNDDGKIAFGLKFTDGDSGLYLFSPTEPEQ